jgi:hypothetical protein
MKIPPPEEWLTAKQVANMYEISPRQVMRARREGRRNVSGLVVKLEMFRTFGGWRTTKKMVEEFLMRLGG